MLGTYVNVVAVVIGSLIGLVLHQRFPEKLKRIGFQAIGLGILLSALPLFLYQGGITLAAASAKSFFTEPLLTELSAVGGVILMGLGIQLLDLKEIRVVNFLPALLVVIILVHVFGS